MSFEYLFTALPPLPEAPGGRCRIAAQELAAMCAAEGGRLAAASAALLIEFDLRALERIQAGADHGETANFTPEAIMAREGLPGWLEGALVAQRQAGGVGYSFDCVWRAYYLRLLDAASELGCEFLARWACFDAGLRRAVASHRASRLRMEGSDLSACDIHEPCIDRSFDYRRVIDSLIAVEERGAEAWREADLCLAEARLEAVRGMSADYSFDMEELLGYVVKFTVLRQSEYLGV